MRTGVFSLHTGYSIDVALLAKRAEELGFDTFWAAEHPILPVTTTSKFLGYSDEPIPDVYSDIVDPFVALARASGVTKRIKLGTGICLVPEHNPLLLAKEIATLDHYSGGRFIFGVGAGWHREETTIMGGDFAHRWTQTREAIEVMKELWARDEAEYHGTYYDFPPVKSFPKPVQKPHPPIFLGAAAQGVFKRTVEWGDGWMPVRFSPEQVKRGRETLDELAVAAGRDPGSIEIIAFGVPVDREALKAYEDAGAVEAGFRIPTSGEKEALAELERIAREILR